MHRVQPEVWILAELKEQRSAGLLQRHGDGTPAETMVPPLSLAWVPVTSSFQHRPGTELEAMVAGKRARSRFDEHGS